MATLREDPYGPFNFKVTISPASGGEFRGGFSDVSGLNTEITHADYREGTDPANRPRKVPLMYKVGDVTLKRGVIDSATLWTWIRSARTDGPEAKRTVVIRMLDERRQPVQTWTLLGVIPLKWTGPTLAGKGGGDVAMEELVLSCEALDFGELGA